MDGAVVADSGNGAEKKLVARSDSGTYKGNDLAGIIGEEDGVSPFVSLGSDRGLGHGRVVVFAVPDVGKHHGTADGGLPVLARRDDIVFAVGVFDLDLARERHRLEAVESEGDPSRPPTGGDLGYDAVVFLADVRDVVFVFKYSVAVVGPAGLVLIGGGDAVNLKTYALTIEEKIEKLIAGKTFLAKSLLDQGAVRLLTEMNNEELMNFVKLDLNAVEEE